VTRTIYRNDKTGAEVEQIALKHGEHAWNGTTLHKVDIPLIGEPSNDINTTDEVANFFMNHRKPSK
jgi:poly(3-hydroxybutyrate) depolymerase